MKKNKLSLAIIKMYMKNQMQSKSFVILDMINMIVRCLVVFLLYGYVFELSGGTINNTEYSTVLWSMFIYFCIMTLSIRHIVKLIMDDVKSGNVEMFLNKPVNYILIAFYKIIGKGLYSFILITIIGVILMTIFVGIPLTVSNWIFTIAILIITFILGITLALIMYSIIGLLSFFMEDVRPIYWIVDKAIMVLGGSYLPIALFPDFLKIITYISPLGAVNFASSVVYNYSNLEFIIMIAIQIIWIVIFTIILKFVFSKVKEKAMINGG